MSNEPRPLPDQHRLSEQEARRLLERVIELDSVRSGEATIGDLRRVMSELNVSAQVFDQAVAELTARKVVPAPAAPREAEDSGRFSDWLRTGVILVVSYLACYTELRGGSNDQEAIAAMLLIGSGALTLFHRLRKTPKAFWADMLALWGAVAAAWLNTGGLWLPDGRNTDGSIRNVMQTDVVAALIGGWFSCTTLGGWIIKKRWSWKKQPGTSGEFAASR
jgi:hypothetical protein